MRTTEVKTLAEVLATVPPGSTPLVVVADVGATNTRFAVVADFANITFCKVRASSAGQVVARMKEFAAATDPAILRRIVSGAIAVPGPVANHAAVIANFDGADADAKTLRLSHLPVELFPAGRSSMLNDLEAAALGVAGVSAAKEFGTVFASMWLATEGPTAKLGAGQLGRGPALVVAPGTGLGCALVFTNSAGKLDVLPLEFSHTNVVAPSDMWPLLQQMEVEMGRHVEYDDLCSGRGLARAYAWFSGHSVDAGEVAKRAAAGEAAAVNAILLYDRWLMVFCSQLVMGFQVSHVVLCGDNIVSNQAQLSKAETLAVMQRQLKWHSTERLRFMSRATVVRQQVPLNLNLVGAGFAGAQHAAAALHKRSKL